MAYHTMSSKEFPYPQGSMRQTLPPVPKKMTRTKNHVAKRGVRVLRKKQEEESGLGLGTRVSGGLKRIEKLGEKQRGGQCVCGRK